MNELNVLTSKTVDCRRSAMQCNIISRELAFPSSFIDLWFVRPQCRNTWALVDGGLGASMALFHSVNGIP